jgi:hypothetical protein
MGEESAFFILLSLALERELQLGLPVWLAWDLLEVEKGGTGTLFT